MVIARRLYVYFIAAVSLGMTGVGLVNLLGLAFARVAEAFGGPVIQQSPDRIRQTVSLYAAFVIVALPVWLFHWWLAERAVHRSSTEGEHERESAIRALFLTLVLSASFLFLTSGAIESLLRVLNEAFGSPYEPGFDDQFWINIATILVASAGLIYHWRIRRRDEQGGELEGAAAWLPRVYLYAATFFGAMFLLFGLADLIRTVDDVLFGTRDVYVANRWWADPLSSGIARTVVGLIAWSASWEWSLRSLRRTDWLGESERRSSLRWFYIYVIVFISVFLTLQGVSSSLESALRWALGAARENLLIGWPRSILEPLVVALPFVAFWIYHRLVVMNAPEATDRVPLAGSFRRLYTYLVAFVGLAFTAVGSAWVLGILIDLLLGGSRTISVSSLAWRVDVARFSSLAVVGAGAWLWYWNVAEKRVAAHGETERSATIRRVYLYLTLAATLVAVLVSLAIVLYRVISNVLGVTSGVNPASAVSASLGIVIVAGLLFAYHLTVLRGDLEEREAPAEVPTAARVPLTLVVPAGGDVDSALDELRTHLPDGYVLEVPRAWQTKKELPPENTGLERDHA